METLSTEKLGITTDLDKTNHRVLINKNEKHDERRMYYIANADDIESTSEEIGVFIGRLNNDTISFFEIKTRGWILEKDLEGKELSDKSYEVLRRIDGWCYIKWMETNPGPIIPKKKSELILLE